MGEISPVAVKLERSKLTEKKKKQARGLLNFR